MTGREQPARAAVKLDTGGETIGNAHAAAVRPQQRVRARRRAVVQDDEVADSLELLDDLLVVVRDVRGIERCVRKVIDEAVEPADDELDARRLERLEKARRESERHAVPVPELAAAPRDEAQDSRLCERRLAEHVEKIPKRCLVIE